MKLTMTTTSPKTTMMLKMAVPVKCIKDQPARSSSETGMFSCGVVESTVSSKNSSRVRKHGSLLNGTPGGLRFMLMVWLFNGLGLAAILKSVPPRS